MHIPSFITCINKAVNQRLNKVVLKQIQNMPVKYSKSSNVDTSPDPQKVGRDLLEVVRKSSDITVYQPSGA